MEIRPLNLIPVVIASLLFISSCTHSAANAGSWSRTDNGVEVTTPDFTVRISCYDPEIVRIEKYPHGASPKADDGLCVSMEPQKARFTLKEEFGSLCLNTGSVKVLLSLFDGTLLFERAEGATLLKELPATSLTPPSQSFMLEEGEKLYGLGQHREGRLNVRGGHYHLLNENMEIAIPLVHSSKAYALFWNNGSITDFNDSQNGMEFTSESGDRIDYFVLCAKDADGVISDIRKLSGKAPMFPLWSLGFFQSRERYISQDETVGIVRWFRENNVPLDCIVQDWQYWGEDNSHWNAVEFGNPRFPDPAKMLADIHDMNTHCMISVWPSFGPETDIYKELEKTGHIMPHSSYPQQANVRNYDPFSSEARDILWNRMRDNIYSLGMDAWWLDATEPEHFPVADGDLDFVTEVGPFRDVRNLYPLASVGGVFDAQKEFDPSKRVLILTRSAALGEQRYAHCWSGDVETSWHTLGQQIVGALNYSLCGLPYWNSDIGGFFTWRNYPQGVSDENFRNIYLRWMQFAVFTGMMRSHGTNTPREIFNFGSRGDFHFDAQEKAIRTRYRLMPYIYSAMHDIYAQDATLMRALMMDWPDDQKACICEDEFMFGKNILVAPVITESTEREVYLPEAVWIDARSGETLPSGVFTANVPLDETAVYVKGGSIIPVGPDVEFTGEKDWSDIQILVYPGADGSFTLYEDEGDGYGYEKGISSSIRFSWDDSERTLTIDKRKGSFPGMLKSRTFRIVLVEPGKLDGWDCPNPDCTIEYKGFAKKLRIA